MSTVQHFYRKIRADFEWCFNVETSTPLTRQELENLWWLLAETFEPECFRRRPFLVSDEQKVIEVGPRLNFSTAFSTNAVAICHSCGLTKVTRLECSRRSLGPIGFDRMTECPYSVPLETFETGITPEGVYFIPLIEEGPKALKRANREMGLGMDDWDINFYHQLFTKTFSRNPTNVECFQLGNNNSEHSRHWFFKGKLVIEGKEVPRTLMEIIQSTLLANPNNSVVAFKDNASAIQGYTIWTIIPQYPGKCSPFWQQQLTYHIVFTAETHNYPSGIEPFQGATTGTGGRIRDGQSTGKGSLIIAGTAGYCVANLNFSDYQIPGENRELVYPSNLASPVDILIGASNGASDYGNKFGEPVIQGFTRTFEQVLPDSERRTWLKPIMFTGGIGQIDARHTEKEEPKKGMLILQVGGPAYRIGVGGGSGSSMLQGENIEELDFNAVQRGDPEMENKLNRVIRACVEMDERSPILIVHDQGAGGPSNVLTELITPAGGRIRIRQIRLGDKTLTVLEIWVAEYQERGAFLIYPERIEEFQAICQREKVHCEVLGEITGDGRIVVYDEQDNSFPVDLELEKILSDIPQKTFTLEHLPQKLTPLQIPEKLSVAEALRMVFRLPSVGSKGFLVRKVDRSVTGLVAQQQCCGPLQLPVADVAVVAQSHFGLTGAATAIGEQPIKTLVDVKAGARMAVGEMLTNLASAKISSLENIKCSANWMWAAKLPGQGALLYDAALAASELMIQLGIAIDGGKDSLSMAAKVGDEIVKAPGELVISGYVTMPDITKKVTPDIKRPGESCLMLVNLAPGKNRLGGSALAQALGQIGDESPDVDKLLLVNGFKALQEMIAEDLILANHDRSDGGLITVFTEMVMAGSCGAVIQLPGKGAAIPQLFSEELGWVIEYLPEKEEAITAILAELNVSFVALGKTQEKRQLIIRYGDKVELAIYTPTLLNWWEATSDRLEQEQMNLELAKAQAQRHDRPGLKYHLTFELEPTAPELLVREDKPKVAVLREEGSNGDREMTSALFLTGFEPWDITMTDLLGERISLDQFRGLIPVGGFSYADVLDPAKGWAGTIKFNQKLREMFERFFNRPDTFSLGICNGCQLMAFLGVVPWQGIPEKEQPRFIANPSERFESHWGAVKILESPSIMLKGMEGSILGIWSAHGGGRLYCPNPKILSKAVQEWLTPVVYVDDQGRPTEEYRLNPNGSPFGITAFCSPDGRHLAMMPHPERSFLLWQWPWVPQEWKFKDWISPWLRMFQNAREWCENQNPA